MMAIRMVGGMDKDELAAVIADIGWSPLRFPAKACVYPREVQRWLNGTKPVPDDIANWVLAVQDTLAYFKSPRDKGKPRRSYHNPWPSKEGRREKAEREARTARRVAMLTSVVALDPVADAIPVEVAPVATPRPRPVVPPAADAVPYRVGQDDTMKYRVQQRRPDPWERDW